MKRKQSPLKLGTIKCYFSVIPKPSPKQPRGHPHKQKEPEAEVIFEESNNNNDDEANQKTSSVRKGASYINYKDPNVAAALKENVEFFLANRRTMTAFDADLSDWPFMLIPASTIRDQAKIAKNKLVVEKDKAPTPPPH